MPKLIPLATCIILAGLINKLSRGPSIIEHVAMNSQICRSIGSLSPALGSKTLDVMITLTDGITDGLCLASNLMVRVVIIVRPTPIDASSLIIGNRSF